MPVPRRHLSSVAVRFKESGEILVFDAGEGTQLSFRRAGLSVLRLSRICITHTHADHVTGIFGLLMYIAQAPRDTPLAVHGPANLARFMDAFYAIESRTPFPVDVQEFSEEGLIIETKNYRVESRFLRHSRPCVGYALTERDRPGRFDAAKAEMLTIPEGPERARLHRGESILLSDGRTIQPEDVVGPARPGRKFVYITDSLPCKGAYQLAEGADLLVAEGMFLHDLKNHARKKWHSTATQAAKLAKRAGVKRLVVTHISPRYMYKDLPLFEEEVQAIFPSSLVARDGLTIDIPGE